MTVHITESAAKRIQAQLQTRGSGIGLRVGVKESGCSGFSFTLDYADSVESGDQVFEAHGAKVVVSDESLPALDGVTVDYRSEGLNSLFRFDHPRATAMCGCGESFSLNESEKD